MAILKDVEVKIQCNKKYLKEHVDDDCLTQTSTSRGSYYVEAVPDAAYQVLGEVVKPKDADFTGLYVTIQADGAELQRFTLRGPVWRFTCNGLTSAKDGQQFVQEVKFAPVSQTPVKNSKGKDTKVGRIKVKVWRLKNVREIPLANYGDNVDAGTTKVSSKKELEQNNKSLCTTFGDKKPYKGSKARLTGDWVDGKKNPYAIFEFRYRDRLDLQRAGVIPWTGILADGPGGPAAAAPAAPPSFAQAGPSGSNMASAGPPPGGPPSYSHATMPLDRMTREELLRYAQGLQPQAQVPQMSQPDTSDGHKRKSSGFFGFFKGGGGGSGGGYGGGGYGGGYNEKN